MYISEFNTSDYTEGMGGDNEGRPPPDKCQYRGEFAIERFRIEEMCCFVVGYRNGPEESNPYDLSPQYWHVFAARLAFVVVFEVSSHIY